MLQSATHNRKSQADAILLAVDAEEKRRCFKAFKLAVWHIIEPAPYVDGWCQDALDEHLEAVTRGDIRKIVINVPPRHTKSSELVIWRAWLWTQDPQAQILAASYALSLSIRDNMKVRRILEDPWFIERYGKEIQVRDASVEMAHDSNQKAYFENTCQGFQKAISVGSGTTGNGGGVLIIDDLHNATEAHSDLDRDSAVRWFREVWTNRANDQETARFVAVGQRIHENDVCGYILKERPDWTHLNLPAEYEPARKCYTFFDNEKRRVSEPIETEVKSFTTPGKKYKLTFVDGKASNCTCESRFFHLDEPCKHMRTAKFPASGLLPFWQDPRTQEGELLWPQRFSRTTLDMLKRDLGSGGYAAQYQQSPVPATGGTFQEAWKCYFEIEGDYYILHTKYGKRKAVSIRTCRNEAVCDLATSERQQSDFFVIEVWAITPENECLLLHQVRGHFNNPDQQKRAIEVYERYAPSKFWVEQVAYQLAYIQQLRSYEIKEEIAPDVYRVVKVVSIPVMSWKPFRDKEVRASVAAVKMEAGDMYWLQGAAYLIELEPEIFKFPKSAKKDQVDCHSMIADILSSPHGPMMWSPDSLPEPVMTAEPTQPQQGMVQIDWGKVGKSERDDLAWNFDEGEMHDFEMGGRW